MSAEACEVCVKKAGSSYKVLGNQPNTNMKYNKYKVLYGSSFSSRVHDQQSFRQKR